VKLHEQSVQIFLAFCLIAIDSETLEDLM